VTPLPDSFWRADLRSPIQATRRSQRPRCLRCRSTVARLLRSWVRIPSGAWMFVCYVCCVLSDRGFCDELITRPRGVLLSAARRCVWSRNLVNEEVTDRAGLYSPRDTTTTTTTTTTTNNNNNNNNNIQAIQLSILKRFSFSRDTIYLTSLF
jgi:hypothetical protein